MFYDLLVDAVNGPAKDVVVIYLYMTGEFKITGRKPIAARVEEFAGRPNWGRCLSDIKKNEPGQHIGVFFCGHPAIASQIGAQCAKNSDKPGKMKKKDSKDSSSGKKGDGKGKGKGKGKGDAKGDDEEEAPLTTFTFFAEKF